MRLTVVVNIARARAWFCTGFTGRTELSHWLTLAAAIDASLQFTFLPINTGVPGVRCSADIALAVVAGAVGVHPACTALVTLDRTGSCAAVDVGLFAVLDAVGTACACSTNATVAGAVFVNRAQFAVRTFIAATAAIHITLVTTLGAIVALRTLGVHSTRPFCARVRCTVSIVKAAEMIIARDAGRPSAIDIRLVSVLQTVRARDAISKWVLVFFRIGCGAEDAQARSTV